jgi:threonine/homoserine/homoserine lactone efflux protein
MTESVTFILGALAARHPRTYQHAARHLGSHQRVPQVAWAARGRAAGLCACHHVLRTAVGPLVLAMPALEAVLSALGCVYLLYLAGTLWRHGDLQRPEARPVTVQGVFLTTLLNPKALIFAFVLLPSDSPLTWTGVVPWLGGLSLLIVTVGGCWIAVGASLRRATPQVGPRLGCRAGLPRFGGACGRHQRARRRHRLNNPIAAVDGLSFGIAIQRHASYSWEGTAGRRNPSRPFALRYLRGRRASPGTSGHGRDGPTERRAFAPPCRRGAVDGRAHGQSRRSARAARLGPMLSATGSMRRARCGSAHQKGPDRECGRSLGIARAPT